MCVSVGDGGFITGCATVLKSLADRSLVAGAEPERCDDTKRCLEAGRRFRIPVPQTIADGQQAAIPGELTFAINCRLVDHIALASDKIVEAIVIGFSHLRVVVDRSGACALAALLAGKDQRPSVARRSGYLRRQRQTETFRAVPRARKPCCLSEQPTLA